MKLIALIEDVNQKGNENLIGDIIIVDSKLCSSGDDVLCYQEIEHGRGFNGYKFIQYCFELRHEVSRVEIIGVL